MTGAHPGITPKCYLVDGALLPLLPPLGRKGGGGVGVQRSDLLGAVRLEDADQGQGG